MPDRAVSAGWRLTACLLALFLVAGCVPRPSASIVPEATTGREVVVVAAPLPTASVAPAPTPGPVADVTVAPLPTAGAGREPLQLVVLHSNDNWGETEPCG